MPGLDPDATLLPKERMKETLQFLGGGGGRGRGGTWLRNSSLLASLTSPVTTGEKPTPKKPYPRREHENQEWTDHQEEDEAGLISA